MMDNYASMKSKELDKGDQKKAKNAWQEARKELNEKLKKVNAFLKKSMEFKHKFRAQTASVTDECKSSERKPWMDLIPARLQDAGLDTETVALDVEASESEDSVQEHSE